MSFTQQNPLSMLSQSNFKPSGTHNVAERSSPSDHRDTEDSFERSFQRAESASDAGGRRALSESEAQQASQPVDRTKPSARAGEKSQTSEVSDHTMPSAKDTGSPPTDASEEPAVAPTTFATPPESADLDVSLLDEVDDLEGSVALEQQELTGLGHDSESPGHTPLVGSYLERSKTTADGAAPLLDESLATAPMTPIQSEDLDASSLAPQEAVLAGDAVILDTDPTVAVPLSATSLAPEPVSREAQVDPTVVIHAPVAVGLQKSAPASSSTMGAPLTNLVQAESMSEALNGTKVSTMGVDKLTTSANKGDHQELALTPNAVTRPAVITVSSSIDEKILEAAAEEAKVGNLKSTATARPDTAAVLQSPSPQSVSGGRVSIPVTVQFGNERWSESVAQNSAKLVMGNIQTAQLQLDPPELGPLTIKIHVQQDQAAVSFVANNAAVKEALDATMVRLRDLLSEQGINLVDTNVSDQSQHRGRQGHGEARGQSAQTSAELAGEEPVRVALTLPSGIDYFV